MFSLDVYIAEQGNCPLRLRIDRSLLYLSYPHDSINTQVICRFTLAQVECIIINLEMVNKV